MIVKMRILVVEGSLMRTGSFIYFGANEFNNGVMMYILYLLPLGKFKMTMAPEQLVRNACILLYM